MPLPPADNAAAQVARHAADLSRRPGGSGAIVLFHDGQHGSALIDALAPPWRRPSGQRAAASRQRGDARSAWRRSRRPSPTARPAVRFPSAGKTPATNVAGLFADAGDGRCHSFPGWDFRGAVFSTIETDDPDALGEALRGDRTRADRAATAQTFRTVGKRPRSAFVFALSETATASRPAPTDVIAPARGRTARRKSASMWTDARLVPVLRIGVSHRRACSTIPNGPSLKICRRRLRAVAACARAHARKRSSR